VKVEWGCPKCGKAIEAEPGTKTTCPKCGAEAALPAVSRKIDSCLVCGCGELYRHRDFNPKVGIAFIALGVLLWLLLGSFWPMVAAAALDLLLYATLPDVAICYRCKAHFRGSEGTSGLPKFDLERHEHYRFEKARGK
jgi:uncharacterized paraquat-inducible protein A